MESWNVVVVGGGNVAFSAAHAAREQADRVLLLEKAPPEWSGGNTWFTAGAFRITHGGLEDLGPLLEELSDELAARTDVPLYSAVEFLADMHRLTRVRCDPTLTRILVEDSAPTIRWLRDKGVRFRLQYERQAYEVGDRYRFWGGLLLGTPRPPVPQESTDDRQ
jgi:tricarballylate dehydrogenase